MNTHVTERPELADHNATHGDKTQPSTAHPLHGSDSLNILKSQNKSQPLNDGFAIVGKGLAAGAWDELKNHPVKLVTDVGEGLAIGAAGTAAVALGVLAAPEIAVVSIAVGAGFGIVKAGELIKDAETIDYAGTGRHASRFSGESVQPDAKPLESQIAAATQDAKVAGARDVDNTARMIGGILGGGIGSNFIKPGIDGTAAGIESEASKPVPEENLLKLVSPKLDTASDAENWTSNKLAAVAAGGENIPEEDSEALGIALVDKKLSSAQLDTVAKSIISRPEEIDKNWFALSQIAENCSEKTAESILGATNIPAVLEPFILNKNVSTAFLEKTFARLPWKSPMGDFTTKTWLATESGISPRAAELLAGDSDVAVRQALASNTTVPRNILTEKLVRDPSIDVRTNAISTIIKLSK